MRHTTLFTIFDHITPSDLAKMLGVSRQSVYLWSSMRVPIPPFRALQIVKICSKISQLQSISINNLLSEKQLIKYQLQSI